MSIPFNDGLYSLNEVSSIGGRDQFDIGLGSIAMREVWSEENNTLPSRPLESDMSREQLERHAQDLQVRVRQLEKALNERFSELAVLTEMLEQGGNPGKVRQAVPSSGRLSEARVLRLLKALVIFKGLKKRLVQYKQAKALKQSSLFDAAWYLEQYPDLASSRWARRHPELHYLRFGAREGRNPGPDFDSQRYLDDNPDIVELDVNPLWHYLEFGQWEGRMAVPASR